MSRGKIPDRWIPYKACGTVIEGTRIICFKVPLNKNVQENVPGITEIWDIPAVLEAIPKLGAVIDLTNTNRYYLPKDFEAANIIHRKMLIPGREIPSEDKVREFMDAVDEFLGNDCEALVGVHCTHGLNRTGYMVCRYMKNRLNIPAEEAIKRFEKARGYQIERKNYIADLLGKTLPPPDFDRNGSEQRVKKPRHSSHPTKRQRNQKKIQLAIKNGSQSTDNNESQPPNKKRKKNKSKKNKTECQPKPKKRKQY